MTNRDFWAKKWEEKQPGFHRDEPNSHLLKHFTSLSLSPHSSIFIPLCGKTIDIHWLLSKGYRVVGVELIEHVVEELFSELKLSPSTSHHQNMKLYSASNIDILVGDLFEVSAQLIRSIDSIYDRAALVALPAEERTRYTQHITALTNSAPQLLITYDYDQNLFQGPPFSVPKAEIERHYQDNFTLTLLENIHIEGGLKGKCPATESVWLLEPCQNPPVESSR